MRRLLLPVVLVLVAALSLVSIAQGSPSIPPQAFQEKVWTSTADFDGGTYSESSGNREVNSNSCNLGITADQIELDSLKGDSFCVADADADTFKWNLVTVGICASRTVSNGVMTVTITDAGFTQCGSVTSATLSGDFDVRIKINHVAAGTNRQGGICLQDIAANCGVAGTDGVWYRNLVATIASAFTLTNGVPTQIGTNSNPGCGETYWLRISQSGTTVTWYYSCNGSTWTQDEQATFTNPANMFATIEATNNGATDGITDFDDFHVAAGTIGAGGFRSAGNWLSDNWEVTGSSKRVGSLNVSHSGLSATYAIDKVELYRNDILRETFLTDITSGTFTVLQVSEVFESGSDFGVKIFLKGDGAGTPVISSIAVTLIDNVNSVSTIAADEIGVTSAMLHGNLTVIAEPSGFVFLTFEYGPSPVALSAILEVGWADAEGLFEERAIELQAGTNYFFRATATGNATGKAVGETLSFTTGGVLDLTDIDFLTLAMFILVCVVLFAFGSRLTPIFFSFSGIFAIFFALEIQRILEILPLTIGILAIAVTVIVYGISEQLQEISNKEV